MLAGAAMTLSGCGIHGASVSPVSQVLPASTAASAPNQINDVAALDDGEQLANWSVPPPTTIPMTHVLTADYLPNTMHVSDSAMAPWLTWAVSTATQSAGLRAVGIHTLLYTNPNRLGPGDAMYPSDETAFAHDCNGHRIQDLVNTYKYLMNPASTVLASHYGGFIGGVGGQFDGYFQDGADNVLNVTALPCGYSAPSWTAASNSLNSNAQVAPRVVYNDLMYASYRNGVYTPPAAIGLNPTALGGMAEGCYSSYSSGNPKPSRDYWAAMEDTELAMGTAKKLFFCRGLNTTAASNAVDLRVYMLASFLLTYRPYYSVLSEKFATPTRFQVDPEEELVPRRPLLPRPADISGLEVSNKVYAREWAACYVAGQLIGPCAAVVNADAPGTSHPFPFAGKYKHTLALQGSDVLDGGSIGTNGPAPAATIPGDDAVIVFQ
jgi:hypothetical protein